MDFNTHLPWTTRLCHYSDDLFIRPIEQMKREADSLILQKGILSANQLDLVYSILAGVGLALLYTVLPTPVGGIIALGVFGLEWINPNLFSKRTWSVLQLAGGVYGIASTPKLLWFALKIDSGALLVLGFFRFVGSVVVTALNTDRLMEHHHCSGYDVAVNG